MTTAQMREFLKKQYGNSQRWSAKVDAMSDSQIYVIYTRILNNQEKAS